MYANIIMNYFGTLNQRTEKMRREILDTPPSICSERAVFTTEQYKKHKNQPVILKRAYMMDEILRNMTIYIDDDALLAGNQGSQNRAAPIFPEYAIDWVIDELDEFDKRPGDRFTISEKNKEILRDIYPYWENRTLKDKGLAAFPDKSKLLYDLGIIKAEGNITSGDAHIAVDYDLVLKQGLESVKTRTNDELNKLNLSDFNDLKKVISLEQL